MPAYLCEKCEGYFQTSEHACGAAWKREWKERFGHLSKNPDSIDSIDEVACSLNERQEELSREADVWKVRFNSLVQELKGLLEARGYFVDKQSREGAALIQSVGLALEKVERERDEWRKRLIAENENLDRVVKGTATERFRKEAEELRSEAGRLHTVISRLTDCLNAVAEADEEEAKTLRAALTPAWVGVARNQCDGCARGLLVVAGIHVNEHDQPVQQCTKDRYKEPDHG